MDEVEADADVDECDQSDSWGEPDEYEVDCISMDEEEQDIDIFPAEVEDLGKRRGTNDAREGIIKKLRETPPNPDTSMGGFKSIPVQKMPHVSRGQYKTYKVAPDRKLLAKKESKDVMNKPVAVPLNHYMGMSFLASKNKGKLMDKLTKDAAGVLDAYVDTLEVQGTEINATMDLDELPSSDSCGLRSITEACPLEINPV